jgi:hypothetical protein
MIWLHIALNVAVEGKKTHISSAHNVAQNTNKLITRSNSEVAFATSLYL